MSEHELYVPTGQSPQAVSSFLAPSTMPYLPIGQLSEHCAYALLLAENVPRAHGLHTDAILAYMPTPHAIHAPLASKMYPGRQSCADDKQESNDVAPIVVLYVPRGHDTQADAFVPPSSALYVLREHELKSDAPGLSTNEPLGAGGQIP